MAERKEQPADPRELQELYAAFEAVDNVVLKKYITNLSQAPCWATMMPVSHSAPTPTPPARSRTKPPRPWAASWHR